MSPVQADDGYLYPLERAFFYVQKPPTLLVHDEIESVEFLRQGGGMLAASAKTFDLSIRMQADQVCCSVSNDEQHVITFALTSVCLDIHLGRMMPDCVIFSRNEALCGRTTCLCSASSMLFSLQKKSLVIWNCIVQKWLIVKWSLHMSSSSKECAMLNLGANWSATTAGLPVRLLHMACADLSCANARDAPCHGAIKLMTAAAM